MSRFLAILGAVLITGCAGSRVSYIAVDHESILMEINRLGASRAAKLTIRETGQSFVVNHLHIDTVRTTYEWKGQRGSLATANVASVDYRLKRGGLRAGMVVGSVTGSIAGYLVGSLAADDDGQKEPCEVGLCKLDFSGAAPGFGALVGAGVGAGLGAALGSAAGGRGERVVFHRFERMSSIR